MLALTNDDTHAVDDLVDTLLEQYALRANPYFRTLGDRSMTRQAFVESQTQFWFAVDYFSRPMTVLAGRMRLPEDRVEILRNAWEEHGEGDLRLHHGRTFEAFLERLSGRRVFPALQAEGPAVGMFNATLAGVCSTADPLVGVAVLGMVERMFVDISAFVGTATIDRGWICAEDLVHYTTHEKLDVKHAEDFFVLLRSAWRLRPSMQGEISRGLRLGAHAFDQLYRGLAA